jgi:hypothetical protein
MNIVFLSNSLNHHQKPFSDEMYRILGKDYKFIETATVPEFRKRLGYKSFDAEYKISYHEYSVDRNYVQRLIDDADAVIIGSASYELIAERIKLGKIVFRISERPLKKGLEPMKYIPRFFNWRKKWKFKNIYLYLNG